jgi:hypothetical protein
LVNGNLERGVALGAAVAGGPPVTVDAARLGARVWTITATTEAAGLNPITYLDACGRTPGKPPTGPDLKRFLPWTATREDLHAWAQPPRPG